MSLHSLYGTEEVINNQDLSFYILKMEGKISFCEIYWGNCVYEFLFVSSLVGLFVNF